MNPVRRKRLILVLAMVAGVGVAVSLTVYALRQNINHFFDPTEISAGKAPVGRTIRVGGMVVEGSVKRDPESLKVAFVLTDFDATVEVRFAGILPDLFREGQGIVARGMILPDSVEPGQPPGSQRYIIEAEEVLAKHDENYMPPEVAASLKKSHNKTPTTESSN